MSEEQKARSPDKQKLAKLDYINGMKQKDIATKHDIPINTLKSWIKRHNWKGDKVAPQTEKVAPLKIEVQEIDNPELNDKQILFCIEYLKCFNATKAYQRVYKCSYATAMTEGHRLKNSPKISQEIERLKNKMFADTKIDTRAVLQKWIDIAFADIGDYLTFGQEERETESGKIYTVNTVKLKDSAELDTSIVTEVKEGREGVSVKLADKMKALDYLSKYDIHLSEKERKRLEVEKLRLTNKELEKESDEGGNTLEIMIKRKEKANANE